VYHGKNKGIETRNKRGETTRKREMGSLLDRGCGPWTYKEGKHKMDEERRKR
jgi:hypothetical protein